MARRLLEIVSANFNSYSGTRKSSHNIIDGFFRERKRNEQKEYRDIQSKNLKT